MHHSIRLATLDYAITGVCFFVMLSTGLRIGDKTQSGTDLFLARRRLCWPAIDLSLFGSNTSSPPYRVEPGQST